MEIQRFELTAAERYDRRARLASAIFTTVMGVALVAIAVDTFYSHKLTPVDRIWEAALLATLGVGIPLASFTHGFGLMPAASWATKQALVIDPQGVTLEFANAAPLSQSWRNPKFVVHIIEYGDAPNRQRSGVTTRIGGGLNAYFEISPTALVALRSSLAQWHYETHDYTPPDASTAWFRRSTYYCRPGHELDSFRATRSRP